MNPHTKEQIDIAEEEALNLSGLTKDKVTFDLEDTIYYDNFKYLIYKAVKQGILNAFNKTNLTTLLT